MSIISYSSLLQLGICIASAAYENAARSQLD
jgi:hypothetical protein